MKSVDWMKVLKTFPVYLMVGAMVIMVAMSSIGCEGPEGQAGADGVDGIDGVDGVDGNVTCLSCHEESNMLEIRFEYNQSQHASGDISLDYAGGRSSCAECHSGSGFVEFMVTGDVEANHTPTAITCNSCHGLHTDFTEEFPALRITADATIDLWDGTTETFGASNMCAFCHQPRRGYLDYDDTVAGDDSASITSSHAGPHHGPQAGVLLGTIGDGRNGTTSIDVTNQHASVACVDCHMESGDHSFWPKIESCTTCHSGLTTFDRDGFQTDIEADMVLIREELVAVHALGTDTVEGVVEYHPHVGKISGTEFSAWWNYMVVVEDKSLGIHNPKFVEKLVANAKENLGL
ncbi:MAG: hypothetical protein KAK01_11450 [Candidatus Marinimicrobia bacterium]|nr:hypothetical protein [Candidatus Neomarinimicrobiota bacterium]